MRAGRTRLTALGCLLGLLAVVGIRPASAAPRPGPPPAHGLHLSAATITVVTHQRVDQELVLPVRAPSQYGLTRSDTTKSAVALPARALVPALARGPPVLPV